jgi:tetratricopeptide (TPR) repeat protein
VGSSPKHDKRHDPANVTAGIIQLFQANNAQAAYDASRNALKRHKRYAPLWHISGLSAARLGKLDEGARALRRATQIESSDAAIWTDLSNLLRQSGETDEAIKAGRKSVELDPALAAAHNNLGVALRQSGDFPAAAAALTEAAKIAPEIAEIHNNLGNCFKSAMQYSKSVAAYQRAIELRPIYAEAMANLGAAFVEMNEWDAAEEWCRQAIGAEPQLAEAHRNLGAALYWKGDLVGANDCLELAVAISPDDPVARKQLALVLIERDDLSGATEVLINGLTRDRTPAGQDTSDAQLLQVTRTKLAHDTQQLSLLLDAGLVPAHLGTVLSDFEATVESLGPEGAEAQIDLGHQGVGATARYCNRVLHVDPAPALPGGALRRDLDFDAIAKSFGADTSGYALVDEILQPDALIALRQFCARSTIWFQSNFSGELGTSMVNGFAAPLIFQIARDLQKVFPTIFGKHMFQACWAYRYYADMSGLALHTDAATVSMNLWITPDEANLDQNAGGLVFWNRRGPPNFFTKPMEEKTRILDAIANEAGSVSEAVPYRSNRALIFGAGTVHRTDKFSFKTGYDDRRSNVTFLFGPPA